MQINLYNLFLTINNISQKTLITDYYYLLNTIEDSTTLK